MRPGAASAMLSATARSALCELLSRPVSSPENRTAACRRAGRDGRAGSLATAAATGAGLAGAGDAVTGAGDAVTGAGEAATRAGDAVTGAGGGAALTGGGGGAVARAREGAGVAGVAGASRPMAGAMVRAAAWGT